MKSSASTSVWPLLIECAVSGIDQRALQGSISEFRDWPTLLAIADEHGMLPVLAMQLRDCAELPEEIRERLNAWQHAQTIFTLTLTSGLFRLLEQLSACGIEVLVIKGPALAARCFHNPGMRQYCDLDLIVRGKDVRRATTVMIELGFQPRVPLEVMGTGKTPGEYVFRRSGTKLLIEFHTEDTFRYYPRRIPVEKLFERQARIEVDGQEVPALSAEDELVLTCIHAAKHLWGRLMWVMDVAALTTRKPGVRWDRAISAAHEVAAARMVRVGIQLGSTMLAAPLPPDVNAWIRSDAGAVGVAAKIAAGMPSERPLGPGIFRRAVFRMRMRGGVLQGAAYLLRLSLSPTEEDWMTGADQKRPWLLGALARPFRLVRKYGRGQQG